MSRFPLSLLLFSLFVLSLLLPLIGHADSAVGAVEFTPTPVPESDAECANFHTCFSAIATDPNGTKKSFR